MERMKFKNGDYVRAVENLGLELTKGKIYQVVSADNMFTKVLNNSGKVEHFFSRRFELADDYILKEIWKDT